MVVADIKSEFAVSARGRRARHPRTSYAASAVSLLPLMICYDPPITKAAHPSRPGHRGI